MDDDVAPMMLAAGVRFSGRDCRVVPRPTPTAPAAPAPGPAAAVGRDDGHVVRQRLDVLDVDSGHLIDVVHPSPPAILASLITRPTCSCYLRVLVFALQKWSWQTRLGYITGFNSLQSFIDNWKHLVGANDILFQCRQSQDVNVLVDQRYIRRCPSSSAEVPSDS